MCVSSPSRIAPAIRALPLSVCRPRRSESEMFWSEGFAFQSRRSLRRGLHTLKGRSEEHTSELQSPCNLVCRLLLEKKKDERQCHDRRFHFLRMGPRYEKSSTRHPSAVLPPLHHQSTPRSPAT